MLEIIGLMYTAVILGCFIEAYFYTELDPESKKFLKEREDKLNKEKKWQQEE
jgi:hypothetical protein